MTCTSIGPESRITRLITDGRQELARARSVAGAQDDLRDVLRAGEIEQRLRHACGRRPRGTRPPTISTSFRVASSAGTCSGTSSGITWTASSSPPRRVAIRAARRISASSSARPDTPTRIRSRVSHGPSMLVIAHVVLQRLVDAVGHPEQRELAQRAEVAFAEVVRERGVDLLGRIDVAVRHPATERERGHVDQLHLIRRPDDLVRDRLALLRAGDPLDDVVQRLQVLDVHGGDDVDAGRRAAPRRPATASRCASRGRSCAPAHRSARSRGAAPGSRPRPSPRTSTPGSSMRPPRDARPGRQAAPAVFGRPCVSTNPTTTSVPRSRRRMPSPSMAKVFPTPAA